ncbi:MAG: hypothetical protein JWQ22_1689 [Devosia sp.]|nr:hypothetical protein [Devosia sp.]
MNREHIAYLQYFRALAIILIVCGHTYAVAWTHFVNEDPQTKVSWINMVPTLINGSTAYFVFISGFLYRHVFYGRLSYGDFMAKKAKYVGLPYLVLGVPLAVLGIVLGTFTTTLMKDGVPYPHSGFIDLTVLLATGRMAVAYWYIPSAMLLFLASPLFDRFIRLGGKAQIAIWLAAIGVALWIHRPVENLNPLQSVVYIANFYLFGMIFYHHRQAIISAIARPSVILASITVMLAIAAIQAMVTHNVGNIEHNFGDGWLPVALDFGLVQKYAGFLVFCGLFSHWTVDTAPALGYVADISFGIFFVHAPVLAVLIRMSPALSQHVGDLTLDLILYTAFVLAISIAIVTIIKRLAGSPSRYIIGC